jgi:pilus assembly protein CpaB
MGRLRGFLWLLAGFVVALLAAYVGFVTVSRAAAAPSQAADSTPKTEVVVATRALPVRSLLTLSDIELKELPAGSMPEGALTSLDDAVGRVALVPLYPGEALLSQRLLEPNTLSADGRFALFITDDEVLVAVPADDYLSRSGVLKPGDKVDVHFSLDFPTARIAGGGEEDGDDEQATFALLQNLQVAAVLGPQGAVDTEAVAAGEVDPEQARAEMILLTVPPQDALVLKYAIDAEGTLSFALRAPDNDRTYEVDPVDVDYMINRFAIPIEVGR